MIREKAAVTSAFRWMSKFGQGKVQHWICGILAAGAMVLGAGASEPALPQLLPFGSEGVRTQAETPTDGDLVLEVIFVDWADQPSPATDTAADFDALWAKITSDGELPLAFARQGFQGNLIVHVHKEWKRMPQNLSHYFTGGGAWNYQDYIDDSAALLDGGPYSPNTIAVVVPDEGVSFSGVNSSAHTGQNFNGIRTMVTLGTDVYNDSYTILLHEIGHCFGSPDLYPVSGAIHKVGGYGMMADARGARNFLGWHLFRYGWLAQSRTRFLNKQGTYNIDLAKISNSSGDSMIVIPDPNEYAKLWVVEIGQDILKQDDFKLGNDNYLNREGDRLIVYTVEGNPPAGLRPIRLAFRTTPPDPAAHLTSGWLDAVSYVEGQSMPAGPAPFSLDVTAKTSDGFQIQITLATDLAGGVYNTPEDQVSPNGQYVLRFQSDGNVVVRHYPSENYFWDAINSANWFAGPTNNSRFFYENGVIQRIGNSTGNVIDQHTIQAGVSSPSYLSVNNSGQVVVLLSGQDVSPPALSDITDDHGTGQIPPGTLVTYTVSFDEDMDDTTVEAGDFGNAGSASVAFGSVTESAPGVFTVQVTPTSNGTLQLRIPAGATLADVAGNALDTSAPILDDTIITVAPPPPAVALNTANLTANSTILTITGTGFSTTPGNNTVAFTPSGTSGSVTAATSTSLTVTGLSGLAPGTLQAVVTTDGQSSGAPVQVATIIAAPQPGPAPLVYLPLNGDCVDASGNGNHGTPSAGVSFGPGAAGQAAVFNGTSKIDFEPIPISIADYTMTGYFSTTSSTNGSIVGLGSTRAALQITGTLRFIDRPGGGNTGGGSLFSPATYTDGVFHHFAIRKSGTSSKLYVDGAVVASGPGALGTFSGLEDLVIGQNAPDSPTRFFIGAIDEIRVYDSALTDAEIAILAGVVGNLGAELPSLDPAGAFTGDNPGWSELPHASDQTGVVTGNWEQRPPAPRGNQWFWLDSSSAGGLYQQVGAVMANTTYSLNFVLGVPGGGVPLPGDFRVGLFSGGGASPATELSVATEASVTAGPGSTQALSLTFTVPAGHPAIGENLFISMEIRSPDPVPGQVYFDDFRLAFTTPSAPAGGALTWTGYGSDNLWTTGLNWGGTAPVPGEETDLAFGGVTRLAPSNDFPAHGDFRDITFNSDAGSFVLGGNAIDLFGKIRNDSSSAQTIGLSIGTGAGSGGFIELDPAAGDLVLNGAEVLLGSNQLRVTGAGGTTVEFGAGTIISGATGSFLLSGDSTVVFRSAHTYGGGSVIDAGTLVIGDGTTNGAPNGTYQINAGGTLRLSYNAAGVTPALTVTDWGNFTGSGTLAMATAKNNDSWGYAELADTFTGTLRIEGGKVGTNTGVGYGFGGASAIDVRPGGQLMDWRGSAITQDLTIAGNGSGEPNLACAVRLADGTSTSTVSGTVALSGSVTIGAQGTGILSNVISGNAGSALTVGTPNCNGTIILTGENTYAGDTIIAHGTLQIGNGGTTGTIGAGTITNDGTLAFYRSDAVTLDQSITGSGAFMKSGGGTLTLTAANTYAGTTRISKGTLAMGLDAALPAGTAVFMVNGTLDASTHANALGTLEVTGAAALAFGPGGSLTFSDSSAMAWTGELRLSGNFTPGASLRFGTGSNGLSAGQLAKISAPGFADFALNAAGYLTAIPVADYGIWQAANNTSQSILEDLDHDGVPNGLEYFLHGTADSSGMDHLPTVVKNAGTLGVTWTKAATYPGVYGTDFVVQTSPSLAPGSWTDETPGLNVVLSGNEVRFTFPSGNRNFARLAVIGESPPPLVVDTSDAIPLRSHIYRQNQFAISLGGSAISGSTPFEANFDTGSWQTCLPYGALNKANLTILETNVRTGWGTLSDKVKGQFVLTSRDGLTTYTIDDFVFYAQKNEDGSDMPDDRTAPLSPAIVGAYPTDDSMTDVLARKYSTNGLGLGIITETPGGNFVANWNSARSYLKFGNDPAMAARLNWYYYEPWHAGQTEFDPITIPGFKVTFSFPNVGGQTYPDIVMADQIATIDTGAPDLTLRLGPTDPHRQAPYSQFFNSARVPSYYSTADCQAMNYGVNVRIDFTGSVGNTSSYSFPTADTNGAYVPNPVYIGDWDSPVPWAPVNAEFPPNRINLGNNLYFFCKVHFWDFTNQRVGFYFD